MKKRRKRKHYYVVKVTSLSTNLYFEHKRGTDLQWAKDLKELFDDSGCFKTVIAVR